jgi:hypothetical protein
LQNRVGDWFPGDFIFFGGAGNTREGEAQYNNAPKKSYAIDDASQAFPLKAN